MHDCMLPHGEGIFFTGKYKKDKLYPLYVQRLKCQFKLKEGFIPTIQLKNNLAFNPVSYLTDSGDEEVTMTLTSVDLKLFFDHYNVYNVEYISGWKFKQTTGLFTEYIDEWTEKKINAKKEDNGAMYLLSKLMLNALYGKFALNPNVRSKIPYYDSDDEKVKFTLGPKETRKPLYIPVGTFITAYARNKTIRSAQSVYDRFVYADTDSLHLLGTDIPKELEVDDYKLGAWKHEATFKKARFIRQKSYVEAHILSEKDYNKLSKDNKRKVYEIDGIKVIDKITCAGMSEGCKTNADFNNFKTGESFGGKLQAKVVKGGVVLKEIDFTIKR